MTWTRIKRWLVEHPRWSLIAPAWIGLAAMITLVIAIEANTLFASSGEPSLSPLRFLLLAMIGFWLLANGF